MKLSVTEAAVLNRNLLFKIESLDLNIEPIFRSYPQIAWLHQKLTATFPDLIIPPLFQAPDPNLIAISDNNHIEQKRLQADRYFSKISSRHQITDNSDFKYFATQMVPSDTLEERKHLIDLSFLSPIVNPIVGPLVNSNYERGFRIYRPAEDIEGNDQDIFLQRQAYILSLESHLNQVSYCLQEVIRIKRDLATSLGYLGDSLLSTLGNIDTLLGSTITDRPAEVTSAFAKHEQFLKTVTSLTDDLETIYERQSVNEQMHVGDVFQEYDNCINSVKGVMNNRTESLVLYVNTVKQHKKKHEKVEKLRHKLPESSHELQFAVDDEAKALELVNITRESYGSVLTQLTRELSKFEVTKARDINHCLEGYVEIQIESEKDIQNRVERFVSESDRVAEETREVLARLK